MPLQQTSGAASYDSFGGGAPVAAKYIEDFFQPWLRTGTGSSTTVTTGLNASINKSLVWTKSRSAATNHKLTDTARGVTKALSSNTTDGEVTDSQGLTAFSSTGYTIGTNTDYNNSGATYVDWQWVATPKFFDVVTYTGNGGTQSIPHNLGSVPGCIIIKCITTAGFNWAVYHRSLGNNSSLKLNTTDAAVSPINWWDTTDPTSTHFTVGSNGHVNGNYGGTTYVAYLFAHDAGGFGESGTDNVISCGSLTTDSSGKFSVNLGYEPQWILLKGSSLTTNWFMFDNMRGMPVGGAEALLSANLSNAETSSSNFLDINATGFADTTGSLGPSRTFIYIAIRRGPMKVPTTGTSVFAPVVRTGTGSAANITGLNFPPDLFIGGQRSNFFSGFVDRLRGYNKSVYPYGTFAEQTSSSGSDVTGFLQDGISVGINSLILLNGSGESIANYFFQRAPSVLDEVCYTGNSVNGRAINHNLTVEPEMVIVKNRSGTSDWIVYNKFATAGALRLNTTAANDGLGFWLVTGANASTFTVSNSSSVNGSSANNYVAYLFASCPGVSKVFNYTGNGSSQTINCGFTGGARFVMIKRTDNTGDWYVWDSARGIVSGNDPRLSLNTTAAEVTTDDSVDTDSTGFIVNQVAATNVNVNAATYIGIAIA